VHVLVSAKRHAEIDVFDGNAHEFGIRGRDDAV
jgi:hypothetical protein